MSHPESEAEESEYESSDESEVPDGVPEWYQNCPVAGINLSQITVGWDAFLPPRSSEARWVFEGFLAPYSECARCEEWRAMYFVDDRDAAWLGFSGGLCRACMWYWNSGERPKYRPSALERWYRELVVIFHHTKLEGRHEYVCLIAYCLWDPRIP